MEGRHRLDDDFGTKATLLRAFCPVEHVGTCDLVLARAHKRELDLVLNVFNVQRPGLIRNGG